MLKILCDDLNIDFFFFFICKFPSIFRIYTLICLGRAGSTNEGHGAQEYLCNDAHFSCGFNSMAHDVNIQGKWKGNIDKKIFKDKKNKKKKRYYKQFFSRKRENEIFIAEGLS